MCSREGAICYAAAMLWEHDTDSEATMAEGTTLPPLDPVFLSFSPCIGYLYYTVRLPAVLNYDTNCTLGESGFAFPSISTQYTQVVV